MKLYLMRHGEYLSEDPREGGALSENGKASIRRIANFLSHANLHVANIFHSGKLRAQQTAELVAAGFICPKLTQARTGINPMDEVTQFANEMAGQEEDVLIVGHMPFMGRLIAKLLTGNADKEMVMLQTGSVVCLEKIENGRWLINWMLSPELISV